MTVLIVDGDESVTLSHFSISKLNRFQKEKLILSAFYDRRKLTVRDLEDRTGVPWTTLRNHIYRMRNSGVLKYTPARVESFYEVV